MKLRFIIPAILGVVVFGFTLTTQAHELREINHACNQSMEAARVAARDVAHALNPHTLELDIQYHPVMIWF